MSHTLTDPKRRVSSVCFSADGNLLVSGSYDKTLKIWSVGSSGNYECQSTLNVDGSISSLDFSPCGTKIAAACNDYDNDKYTVKILGSSSESAGTFECKSTLAGHNGYVPAFPCSACSQSRGVCSLFSDTQGCQLRRV